MKGNQKIIIGAGVLILIIMAVLGYLLFGKSNTEKSAVSTQAPVANETMDEVGKLFADAFEGNASIKCVYTQGDIENTTYIKNGKMRSDTKSTQEGMNGSMLYIAPNVYTWQTGATEGYMIDTSAYKSEDQTAPQQYTSPEDVRTALEANSPKCTRESISDSMFELPSDVTFQDMNQLMQEVRQQIPEGMQLPEGVQIPEGLQNPEE